jgi:hypothetical protein
MFEIGGGRRGAIILALRSYARSRKHVGNDLFCLGARNAPDQSDVGKPEAK